MGKTADQGAGTGSAEKRLWEKGEALHAEVHRFTVGNDPEIDRRLAAHDAVGSAAQARMLQKIGILTAAECKALLGELQKIREQAFRGEFTIPHQLEDCHTAIESVLTQRLGDLGGKIHTGRSRNDQVLLAMRLYLREQCVSRLEELAALVSVLRSRFDSIGEVPLPGYTHMQPAMPASIGMWLHAQAEAALELLRDGLSVLERIDSNPLGAASGFGVPLPLDREYVAELLAFARVQRSPIDAQNSRGRYEMKFLRWGVDVGSFIEKLASDLLLYSMREFGFVALPPEMTTGSSIMPQKHNPDVLELLRARASQLRAAEFELQGVTAKLPSNYHRDFQFTKEPVVRGAETLAAILPVVTHVLREFTVDQEKLKSAMSQELYVTYDAFKQVRAGTPFRDAYRETAKRYREGTIRWEQLEKEFAPIQELARVGMKAVGEELAIAQSDVTAWREKIRRVEDEIFRE